MFKYFHFGILPIAKYSLLSFAAVLKTILQVMDCSIQLHSNNNPQNYLDISEFEDSLTTKKLMPFSADISYFLG